MFYLGVDYHKSFSHIVAMDKEGREIMSNKITNDHHTIGRFLKHLNQPCTAVVEATRTWGVMYDMLEDLGVDVKLANPLKVRAIADAKIKTDSVDAHTLADLLRANLIPEVYVAPRDIRAQKNILRQRMWLVKLQTMTKNRIHQIIDRNHIQTPPVTDIFGSRGKTFLKSVVLPEPDNRILKMDLELLDNLKNYIKETEKWIDEFLKENHYMFLLNTVPGFGKIFSALTALEIHNITRFRNPYKFANYCGLIPSTYASSKFLYHGRLIPCCNKWLRYVFIEAAWTAIRTSPYCLALFSRLKYRKGDNISIVAVAKRLSEIVYQCLKENRSYEERPYIKYANSFRMQTEAR